MREKDLRRGRPDGHKRVDMPCSVCGVVRKIEERDLIRRPGNICVRCATVRSHKTHGASVRGGDDYDLHKIWMGMRQRCLNPNNSSYRFYGARGIGISEDWGSFENFRRDMGSRPAGHTLDRIDTFAGYSRDNCRWVTRKEQANNTRANVQVVVHGETLNLAEAISRYSTLSRQRVYARLCLGWDALKALTTPVGSVNHGQDLMRLRRRAKREALTTDP